MCSTEDEKYYLLCLLQILNFWITITNKVTLEFGKECFFVVYRAGLDDVLFYVTGNKWSA